MRILIVPPLYAIKCTFRLGIFRFSKLKIEYFLRCFLFNTKLKASIASLCCFFYYVSPLSGQIDTIGRSSIIDIECVAKPVSIKTFVDAEDSWGKKFKIVAGRSIKYSAKHGEKDYPFLWSLEKNMDDHELDYEYVMEGISPATVGRAGTLTLEDNTLLQLTENEYFGPAIISLDNDIGGSDSKTVEIFFEKEAIHTTSGNPNWFEYWQDNPIIKALLESVPRIKQFDLSTCKFVEKEGHNPIIFTYDANKNYVENYTTTTTTTPTTTTTTTTIDGTYGSHSEHPPPVEVGAGTSSDFCADVYSEPTLVSNQPVEFFIKLGPGASKKKFAWERGSTILEGIHVFYSTLAHEVEHAQIFYDNWKDGYDKSKDDDGDDYHDDWENIANSEMDQSSFYPKPYGEFDIEINDEYHSYDPDSLFQDPPQVSSGTDYEEWRCLKKEYYLFSQLNEIDEYDWSYDPPVENNDDPRLRTQGKQW